MSYIEKGDLFRDKDKRTQGRIVRVVERGGFPYSFLVENVEHWNEKLIGRRTLIQLETLHNRFEKVSH